MCYIYSLYILGLCHWHRKNHIIWLPQCQWSFSERCAWSWPLLNYKKKHQLHIIHVILGVWCRIGRNGILLKFVPKGLIDNKPVLVQVMAWRRTGDKPLSEPMLISSLTHIWGTRGRWVNANNVPFPGLPPAFVITFFHADNLLINGSVYASSY